jgi:hypothetical protein
MPNRVKPNITLYLVSWKSGVNFQVVLQGNRAKIDLPVCDFCECTGRSCTNFEWLQETTGRDYRIKESSMLYFDFVLI